jgi:hypothetical protein
MAGLISQGSTWTLMLRDKNKLRAFQNGVLRRVFVSSRDEVTRRLEKTA